MTTLHLYFAFHWKNCSSCSWWSHFKSWRKRKRMRNRVAACWPAPLRSNLRPGGGLSLTQSGRGSVYWAGTCGVQPSGWLSPALRLCCAVARRVTLGRLLRYHICLSNRSHLVTKYFRIGWSIAGGRWSLRGKARQSGCACGPGGLPGCTWSSQWRGEIRTARLLPSRFPRPFALLPFTTSCITYFSFFIES